MKGEYSGDDASVCRYQPQLSDWLAKSVDFPIRIRFASVYPVHALYDAESAIVANSVAKRKAEFAAGRYCARQLLDDLGFDRLPVLSGPKGEPLWPPSIIGSISHEHDLAVAAVSNDAGLKGLGIDLLRLDHDFEKINAGLIAGKAEISGLGGLLERTMAVAPSRECPDPLLLAFSLKESAIKAVSPLIDYYLDFREIVLRLSGDSVSARFVNLDFELDTYWTIAQGFVFSLALAKNSVIPGFDNRSRNPALKNTRA